MRSENVVLTCCLMFAAVMLSGLTIQSCRSAKINKSVSVTDSVGSSHKTQAQDSLFFMQLIERYRKQFTFRREFYEPVKDSIGQVIGSVLSERQTTLVNEENQKDSTSLTASAGVAEEQSQTDVTRQSETVVEKKSPEILVGVFGLVILIGIGFFLRRRF